MTELVEVPDGAFLAGLFSHCGVSFAWKATTAGRSDALAPRWAHELIDTWFHIAPPARVRIAGRLWDPREVLKQICEYVLRTEDYAFALGVASMLRLKGEEAAYTAAQELEAYGK